MQSRTLLVLVRGWTNSSEFLARVFRQPTGGEFPDEFLKFIDGIESNCEVLVPKLKMEMFSCAEPRDIVLNVISEISSRMDGHEFDRITIVGFSTGALIVRSVLTTAHGLNEKGGFIFENRCDWVNKVERVVYLAGILRGWSISSETTIAARVLGPGILALVRTFGRFLGGRGAFISKCRKGMPFVVGERLNWIFLEEFKPEPNSSLSCLKLPEIINILGSRDEFVSPADCIELAPRARTIYLEVPSTNHLEMLRFEGYGAQGDLRREIIKEALVSPFEILSGMEKYRVELDDLSDYFDELDRPHRDLDEARSEEILDAVIVLHGIRDHGFWTKRIARRIKSSGARSFVRVPTPGYGFFSVLDFINPVRRRKQARWLAEQYVEIRDYYRNAKVSFVGHSNGTYLLKSALDQNPNIKFNRVYLAGSVLRTDLDWDIFSRQISGKVVNITGSSDIVVAFLPGAMQRLGLKFLDVGGAGFSGFTSRPSNVELVECETNGSHFTGVSEDYWGEIADFILFDKVPMSRKAFRPPWKRFVVWLAPLLLMLNAVGFLLLLWRASAVLRDFIILATSLYAQPDQSVNDGALQVIILILLTVILARLSRLL
ncbi:hypothetical protein [Mangrovicoccus sp. HB161399]|uniref:hypothetical protein n=1 Tax=Mangrovicoccus sp. HB161399 TaxID=2720392 RepID=UPI0015580A2D|nr:hypothetical protein [Mangrovicoccus sp. HB161399]